MINPEGQRLRIKKAEDTITFRSIGEQNGTHCVEERRTDGESIADVDVAPYFKRLKGIGVDQFQALKIVFDCRDKLTDESVPVETRRAMAQTVRTAVEALPKKLKPVYEPVSRK